MVLRVLDVSWNESNNTSIYLPEMAAAMKAKEKEKIYDPFNLPVSILDAI